MSTETKNKRMKRVFGNFSEIVHLWANKTQDEAKCRNGYFEGDTIYSYGRHFPIARIYTNKKGEDTVFFTTRTYSSTTGGHINYTAHASSHKTKLYMHNIIFDFKYGEMTSRHKSNIADFVYNIRYALELFAKAKENKYYHYRSALSELNRLDKYLTFFKIKSKIDAFTKRTIKTVKSDKWQKEIDAFDKKKAERLADPKLAEKREKARAARERKELEKNAEQIEEWRNFETYRPYSFNGRRRWQSGTCTDLLRYDAEKQRIETSQNVKIPVEIAYRFYRYIQVVLAKGGCTSEECCNYKLLDTYRVTEITDEHIRVGCHRIKMSEIQLMVTKLGWV